MHPARHALWISVMVRLCACAHDPASLDGMMDELVRSAPEEPDTQLFEDSIRWHHEMFAYEALFRTLTPWTIKPGILPTRRLTDDPPSKAR